MSILTSEPTGAQSTQENLVCRPGRYMPKLERLDLSLAFPFSDVPEEISQLSSLKALRFRGSTELSSLTALSNLPDLTALDLCASEFIELPHDIGKLRTLQQLNLCDLEKLAVLPDSLFDLPCLVRLALVNNPQLRNVPPSIDRLKTLEELLLTGCLLLRKLPLELQNLTRLRRLDLSGCPLLTQEHRIYVDACPQVIHTTPGTRLPSILHFEDPIQLRQITHNLHGVRAVTAYLRDYYADEPTRQYLLKLVLIGPTMAGKTSLIYGLKHGKARLADKDTERTICLHVDRWKVTDTKKRSRGPPD
jgi:Leucine-rich repeat (LRR) protein